jgi:integrase
MGKIRLRGRTWYIDYRCDGRRIKERVGPSKSLAKQVLAKRETEIAEGRFFPKKPGPPLTFGQMTAKWWQLHGQHLKSGSAKYMRDKLLAVFKDKRAVEMGSAELQQYYNLRCADSSVSTANKYLALIAEIFTAAERWGDFAGRNPTRGVKKQRMENRRDRFLSEEEIRSLLGMCSPRIYPILVCALLTGMRRGEILGLCWENVSLNHNLIYILQSKTGRPREIPLAPKLKEVLLAMPPRASGPVFDVPVITLRRYFERTLKAAGIPACRFHDLRHTFASHFVMQTGNLAAAQRVLGHASPRMTHRYAHLAQDYMMTEMLRYDRAVPVGGFSGAKGPQALPAPLPQVPLHSHKRLA